MATLTQMENFQTAVEHIAPDCVIDTDDPIYIRLDIVAPTCAFALYALTDMLTKLAHAHRLHFDGYDENGHPCFINEGDI